ncbi:MAG: hypothetical protein E7016_07780 [Alphaproteobacteria bacterium]|nr:hypothetical protein [Alphaproteobacteria bacterium]
MRKYFLLSAVALLATSTANATTDYAEVTAKATIEVANIFECGDIDWGTIVVKQNNEPMTLRYAYGAGVVSTSNDFISANGKKITSSCTDMPTTSDVYVTTELTSNEGNKLSLSARLDDGGTLETELTIPAKVPAGEYTGSFTVTIVE